ERVHLDDVEADDVEAAEAVKRFEQLPRRAPARLGRPRPRGEARVDHVDVDRDVNGPPALEQLRGAPRALHHVGFESTAKRPSKGKLVPRAGADAELEYGVEAHHFADAAHHR